MNSRAIATLVVRALVAAASAVAVPLAASAQAGAPPKRDSIVRPVAAVRPPPPGVALDRVVAVVGTQPILLSDVLELANVKRAQGARIPTDSAGQVEFARGIVNELVDEEVMVQKAKAEKVEVTDADVAASVDQQVKRVRDQFKSDAEFRDELKRAGLGSPEEYRRSLTEQARRQALFQRGLDKLKTDGKLVPVAVSEADVTAAFEKNKATLPKRPPTIAFRQIIVAPVASPAAKAAARAKAESLLVEIRKGGDFEQIAKRESMDPGSKEVGGDLGWNRRGAMVPEFDRMMFALPPGQVSPVVETSFGYHIIRVDRVQPAEVKARHILIRPKIDSTDIARAHAVADTVLTLWKSGTPFDTLVARYHDRRNEDTNVPAFDRSQLPPTYATAFEGKNAGDFAGPFAIEDKQSGAPKYVVARVTEINPGGEYTVADLRSTIRDQLQQERSIRRLLDDLRKDVYVSIRVDDLVPSERPGAAAP
ncbi:MAG TPA: peptidylprolyl isomerase [Gemmatimonadaceae bacterium]|nr:peptidylprolyl isomerase [Gemmatimonadaceae bacterium]